MEKNINTMYKEAMQIMNDLNITVGNIISVRWNYRLKSVWGRCTYVRRSDCYKIELNPILNEDCVSWESAMNTMIHEVLHAHKDRMCHTGEWKMYAHLINYKYPQFHIERCSSAESKNVADKITHTYKYEIKCANCGAITRYKNAGKIVKLVRSYPGSCRCSCGCTNLMLFEN